MTLAVKVALNPNTTNQPSILSKTEIIIYVTFILLSANTFNLDKVKFGLMLMTKMTGCKVFIEVSRGRMVTLLDTV